MCEKNDKCLVVYVDGSYSPTKKKAGYGIVYIEDTVVIGTESGLADKYLETRNIAGELTAAARALIWAVKHGYKTVQLHYDYAGIEKWVNGEWETKKECSIGYKECMLNLIEKYQLSVTFKKIKSHSGDLYNNVADTLAKEALTA